MGEDFPFARRHHLGVDGDHDALAAEFLRSFAHEVAVVDGGGHDRHLVRARQQELADVLGGAHAPADRQRHETGLGRAANDIENDAAIFVAGGDVEKAQFVRARLVIGDGAFHGIARIAQIDEVHALDDASVLDVEAGDDPALKQARPPWRRGSAPAPWPDQGAHHKARGRRWRRRAARNPAAAGG